MAEPRWGGLRLSLYLGSTDNTYCPEYGTCKDWVLNYAEKSSENMQDLHQNVGYCQKWGGGGGGGT